MLIGFWLPTVVGFLVIMIAYTCAKMLKDKKKKKEMHMLDNIMIAIYLIMALMIIVFFSYSIGIEILKLFFGKWG